MVRKRIVENHASLVIAHNLTKDKFLFSVYDSTYNKGIGPYPLTASIIGGDAEIEENGKSPLEVILREVNEEFDPDFQNEHPSTNDYGQRVAWANSGDIRLVKDDLIEGINPLMDFYVQAEHFSEGTFVYKGIFSYFSTILTEKTFDIINSNLRRQKSLVTEGLVGIFSLSELENDPRGPFSTAHPTAPVLNYLFNTAIPYPEQIKASPIGIPKKSFTDYLNDFTYSKESRLNHLNPTIIKSSIHEILFGR